MTIEEIIARVTRIEKILGLDRVDKIIADDKPDPSLDAAAADLEHGNKVNAALRAAQSVAVDLKLSPDET